MGKKVINHPYKGTQLKHVGQSSGENLVDPASRNFIYDDLDDFHDNQDKEVLGGIKFKGDSDSSDEEDVLGLGDLSSDEDGRVHTSDEELFRDDDDDIMDESDHASDDERAWGKQKRMFFGTDTTDERIHREASSKKVKEDSLKMEEEGARKLQERMAQQLEGLSFSDLIPEIAKYDEIDKQADDKVEIDISRMSRKKKIRLLMQESPEFFPIVQDLKEKAIELEFTLAPIMKAVKDGSLSPSPIVDYLKARYCLTLNYVMNVCSYMLVKTSGTPITHHPVVSRLAQYRHLFKELEPCQTLYETEITQIIDDIKSGKLKPKKKKKLLSLLSTKKTKSNKQSDSEEEEENREISVTNKNKSNVASDSDSENESEPKHMDVDDQLLEGDDDRRPIGKKIMKNKGLMPKRSKERANPRIKYKQKYKDKLKRRKGQVRSIRKETNRYDGEISGIKKSVIKSRVLK